MLREIDIVVCIIYVLYYFCFLEILVSQISYKLRISNFYLVEVEPRVCAC